MHILQTTLVIPAFIVASADARRLPLAEPQGYASFAFEGFTAASELVLRTYAVEWDWGPVLSAYTGLFLMGGLFLAIGLSTSAWAQSQVVAFVVATPLILICLLNGTILNMNPGDSVEALVRHTNTPGLQQLFAKGVVELKALVYYLSATWFFLFVAVRGVASHRWK